MKLLTKLSITPDQATKIASLGGEHRNPKSWQEPTGWFVPEDRLSEAEAILAPAAPEKKYTVTAVRQIAYDPGVRYYEIDYTDLAGNPQTRKLQSIRLAAQGVGFGRGMDIDKSIVGLYDAALDAAKKHFFASTEYQVNKTAKNID